MDIGNKLSLRGVIDVEFYKNIFKRKGFAYAIEQALSARSDCAIPTIKVKN
jgi:hypothetical protein